MHNYCDQWRSNSTILHSTSKLRLYKNAWIHKLDSKSVVNDEISKFSK